MSTWSEVLARIEQVVDRAEYDTWLAPTRFLGQKGDTIELAVPTQRYVDEIRERFGARIRGFLNEITPERIQIHFVVEGSGDDIPFAIAPPKDELPNAVFSPRYRFETFVVGNSNQLAYAASKSIAENPSGSFNPLFIYGGAGLGKTHLIQAIGQQVREMRPKLKVAYMSAESFVTELITSIRYDRMQSFRDRYRSVDALLLDDIQFIGGKERTQEEFFHTFNALYESQKQIIFTSDRPPKEIPTLEERLRSRFEWGLTADIQPPDLETKVAILRKKAEEKGVEVPQEVAIFVAERVRSNIRELEGHLNKIIAFASMVGRAITIDVVKEALKDSLSKEDKPITPTEILRVVATHYGLKVSDIKQKSNAQTIAFPRQVAMYLCKELTDLSYPEIGKLFADKHHSTVMYSVQQIKKKMDNDQQFARTVETLSKQFR
ncbi:MAG: chromosomal replication initiator protein DnaA [Acidobacteria bacterium]|nr:chromosomal replication initiator protein DnaA [Acidobacteriota bacterium]MBV9475828.1 chromosomal replication initiator protein DnaA [Acidobacteriota bacterium]